MNQRNSVAYPVICYVRYSISGYRLRRKFVLCSELANLPGIDISSSNVDFANDSDDCQQKLTQILCFWADCGGYSGQDLRGFQSLTPEGFSWLKRNFPGSYVRNRSVGVDVSS